jgi:hypothetical protein
MELTVHDLYEKYKKRKKHDHEIYRTILQEVYSKIEESFNKKKYNVLYRVPHIVYGNSIYDIKYCLYYITTKLVNNGYIVYPYQHNYLIIDWSCIKTFNNNNNKKQKRVRFQPQIKNE